MHEGPIAMPTISTNDLKNGMTLEIENVLWNVVEFQHVKPGKGHAFVRTKLKNARSGQVVERTFRADEKVERAMIDKREMQYLYRDGNDLVFMDNESYDQLTVPPESLGDAVDYLVESNSVVLLMHGDDIVGTDLPAAVELGIAETEPGVQGDRVSGARKPATLVTGLVVQVPLFVNPGDVIKVDTRSGEYLSRG
jgi:elongation factor P